MKKCGIMTFNQAINYGAVFQMLALQKTIERLGVECEIINYQSDFMNNLYRKRTLTDWFNLKTLYHTLFSNSYIRYNLTGFEDFICKNIKMSSKTYSAFELKDANDIYDIFISGSDQVFNVYCSNYDYNYMLGFVDDDSKKFSYAASLGLNSIPNELRQKYIEILSGFQKISIREKTGAIVLNELLGVNCQVNLDPTLLLSKNEWSSFSVSKENGKPYILVYVLSEDKALFDFARNLAKMNNCDLYYINDRLFEPFGMKRKRNVDPDEWLSLFENAMAIVTNSFHGVAFSIIFSKRFFPFLLNKNTRVNSRISDLLSLTSLDDLLFYHSDVKMLDDYIFDYHTAHNVINYEKKKSVEYLRSIFE